MSAPTDFPAELRRLFAWNDWANRETLRSLESAGTPPDRARALLAHIVGSEWLWWTRLENREKRMAVWPDLPLERMREEIAALRSAWDEILRRPCKEEWSRRVEYVNSKGEPWTSSVSDVLNHIVTHSAYHRGQIAAEMRARGNEPAYTDFIEAVRRGFVK